MQAAVQVFIVASPPQEQVAASLHEPVDQHPKYNEKMLEFLGEQLAQVESLPPEGVTQSSVEEFQTTVQKGERLIAMHKGPFSLRTFYMSTDVKDCVSDISDILCDIVKEWQRDDTVAVKKEVPAEHFETDKEASSKMLKYIISGDVPSGEVLPQHWKGMKREHEE
ncbi:unnamed protein product [Ostreobium quekettii]|uniref:Uncharacterized protein n=1 Tax=Ostreobium quekettii TaxID=121088 RepID=A0A8S1IXZ5_9CHLO|nr:unnamed protein product [Ostreobium quekettii]